MFPHQDNFKVTLEELVAHECPCLDCDVFVRVGDGKSKRAHSDNWYEEDALEWTRAIAYARHRVDERLGEYIAKIIPLVRVIQGPDGEPSGRAAISFANIEVGIASIGGLVSSSQASSIGSLATDYVGALGYEPDGPMRNMGQRVSARGAVEAWATDQATLLSHMNLGEWEKYLAAANVAQFGGDATPIAMILLDRKPTYIKDVFNVLQTGASIYGVINDISGGRNYPSFGTIYHEIGSFIRQNFRPDEIEFLVPTLEGWHVRRFHDDIYHVIAPNDDEYSGCFVSLMSKCASANNRSLKWEHSENTCVARYNGVDSPREKLNCGMEIRRPTLRLWLE